MIKTVILCGGRGKRLKPLTNLVPKPLVTLNGKPLLHHLVTSYLRRGVDDFILCVGYREEMIREFVAQHNFSGNFGFSNAGEDACILKRLHFARTSMSERVFIAYGDTLIDVDLQAMLARHQASKAKLTITIAEVQSPFGLVSIDDGGWCTSFVEKPSQLFFIGHMLLERSILETLDPVLLEKPDAEGLVELFEQLTTRKQIQTHYYRGPRITFNTQQELDQAEQDFIRFFTQKEDEL